MKPVAVLAVALHAQEALCFGIRGAVERATFLSIYYAQEVFDDASKWTMAPGCKGRREGIGGQKNRCDLLEFIEHIWAETMGAKKDERGNPVIGDDGKPERIADIMPDTDRMRNTKADGRPFNLAQADIWNSAQQILKFQERIGNEVPRTHTNNFNPGKILKDFDDFEAVIREAPKRLYDAREAIKVLPAGNDKNNLNKWVKQAEIGVELAYELRLQDGNKFLLAGNRHTTPPVKSLSDFFGHPIEVSEHFVSQDPFSLLCGRGVIDTYHLKTREHRYPDSFYTKGGSLKFSLLPFQVPDREASIEKYKGEFGSREAAATAYDDALTSFNAQDGGKHAGALDAAAAAKENIFRSC